MPLLVSNGETLLIRRRVDEPSAEAPPHARLVAHLVGTIELIFRALKWTMNGVYVITEHEEGINSFFAALFLTALLHIHLKRDCLAQEGHLPPLSAEPPDVSEGYVQISADCTRTTTHLAIARFMAQVNMKLALFWKVPKHWLKALAANLHRPFTIDIVRALNKHALTPF